MWITKKTMTTFEPPTGNSSSTHSRNSLYTKCAKFKNDTVYSVPSWRLTDASKKKRCLAHIVEWWNIFNQRGKELWKNTKAFPYTFCICTFKYVRKDLIENCYFSVGKVSHLFVYLWWNNINNQSSFPSILLRRWFYLTKLILIWSKVKTLQLKRYLSIPSADNLFLLARIEIVYKRKHFVNFVLEPAWKIIFAIIHHCESIKTKIKGRNNMKYLY